MPPPTADQVAAKWKTRAGAAGADWLNGIKRTDVDPAAAAVAQKAKYVAKMSDPLTHDKWATNLGLVSKASWVASCEAKGSARYTSGINAAVDKYRQRIAGVLAHIQAGRAALEALPNVTIEDAIARSAQFIRHMATYQRAS